MLSTSPIMSVCRSQHRSTHLIWAGRVTCRLIVRRLHSSSLDFADLIFSLAQFSQLLRTRAPDWWLLQLDCAVTICHQIFIGVIPVSFIAASDSMKLDSMTISHVVHRVLRQYRQARGDPSWLPQEGTIVAQRSAMS